MRCGVVKILKKDMANVVPALLIIFSLFITTQCVITDLNLLSLELESHVVDTVEFIIINTRLTWMEANIMCKSFFNGTLAILDTAKKLETMADLLSNSDLPLEHLWIGARYQSKQHNKFYWLHGEAIDERFGPVFVYRVPMAVTRKCLAFKRKEHNHPHFIDLSCTLRRPFICQQAYQKEEDAFLSWIQIGNYSFTVVTEPRTWYEAVSICAKKYGGHLASFRTILEMKTVARVMLFSRPSLENAWFGGYFDDEDWRYISDDRVISNLTNTETLYPNWHQDTTRNKGCLMLDRHLDKEPEFVATRCQRKRGFICGKDDGDNALIEYIVEDNTAYFLFYMNYTWTEAYTHCLLFEGCIVEVTVTNIHKLIYYMGEKTREIKHIWIGGRYLQNINHFIWVKTSTVISRESDLNHYPPWFDTQYSPNNPCLNLDREEHVRPMFYGLDCEYRQPFMCEKDLSCYKQNERQNVVDSIVDGYYDDVIDTGCPTMKSQQAEPQQLEPQQAEPQEPESTQTPSQGGASLEISANVHV